MTALFGYAIEVELTEYNGIRNGVKLYNKGEVIGKVTEVKQGNDGYIFTIEVNDNISIEGKEKFIRASNRTLIIDYDLINAEEEAAKKAAEEAAAQAAAEEAAAKAAAEEAAAARASNFKKNTKKAQDSSPKNYNTNSNFSVSNNNIKPYTLGRAHAQIDAKTSKSIASRFFWGAAGFGSVIVGGAIGLPIISSGVTVAAAYFLTPRNVPIPPERFYQAKKTLNQQGWDTYHRAYSLKRWEIERRKNAIAAGVGVGSFFVLVIGFVIVLISVGF